MQKKLNNIEKTIIEEKLAAAYDYIKKQHALKKELRSVKGLKRAIRVRDTMSKWLSDDIAIKEPTPVIKSAGTALFENLCESMQAGQEM